MVKTIVSSPPDLEQPGGIIVERGRTEPGRVWRCAGWTAERIMVSGGERVSRRGKGVETMMVCGIRGCE